ncbi:glutamate 5-kinase [Rubellicoccus peritrichatus]|uniref:Glutamate 5-kinase n=1 Tax=Rubellicoccus peritrichatus TaxID=3080537 RepID=A0AAQ3LDD6_9BACT|nr:glutamate 5-kinase [Puniceicoccus sp. CR14]WOO39994.1 glutamate 5-kinase [Puniceicoccus sp. CR14]
MPPLQDAQRIVIKLGTGILTSGIGQLDTERIDEIGRQVASLKAEGKQVILVSSGAVGLGMGRLGLSEKPRRLASLQKCAAIGQSRLTETWQKAFDPHGIVVAQILLTRDDVQSRKRHLALRELLDEILSDGIIPIVNENDSVSADEIKFGDNDVLSSLVASLAKADMLCILSTANGLENRSADGSIIPIVDEITDVHMAMAGGTESATGTGGMTTKLEAAKIATKSGCGVYIGNGNIPNVIQELFSGSASGTIFLPKKLPIASRKRWLAFFQNPNGDLVIDDGAVKALCERGSSLLAKGILNLSGTFKAGETVTISAQSGTKVARGIVTFDADEIEQLRGKRTDEVKQLYPERKRAEIIHRDALVLL